ncbi:unnamed protein product [Linum trigynum]|uniref:Uncharacterized protein n=1 Tax=Linum trigynum TaxID=586398 RepID=A0AAV2GPH9_9ROSI
MGELLHGEESKSRIRHGIRTAKDGFLLLDVDWHFSKLKLASNGVEDQSRALGNSCSSLSLSRSRSFSQKLESPRVVAENLLKSISGQSTVEGTAVLSLIPPVSRPGLNYTASKWVKHGRALQCTRPCFGGTRPCFGARVCS